MRPPLVSVLLPARDAASTLDRAMASVLAQTEPDLEVIALDDRSRDATGTLLRSWAARDPRVRLFEGEGRGLVAVLNRGLAECSGEYIARMDADDEAMPGRLAESLRALREDPSLAGVGTQVEIFRDDQPVSPSLARYGAWLNAMTTPEELHRNRFIESPLCHPSVTLRAAALREAGGFRQGPFPEDYELWLRLLSRGHRLRCVDQVLHRWRDHDQRITRTDERYERTRFFGLKAEYLAPFLTGRGCIVWGTGPTGLKLARALRTHGVQIHLFVEVSRKKIGQTIHGVKVISEHALPPPGTWHLLGAVGAHGARDEIREILVRRGWRETIDFTFTA